MWISNMCNLCVHRIKYFLRYLTFSFQGMWQRYLPTTVWANFHSLLTHSFICYIFRPQWQRTELIIFLVHGILWTQIKFPLSLLFIFSLCPFPTHGHPLLSTTFNMWSNIPPCQICAKLLQWCPILCGPTDCSPPGSSVHGIFQARILEWVAVPSSKRSSQPRDKTHISYVSCIGRRVLLPLAPPGKLKLSGSVVSESLRPWGL